MIAPRPDSAPDSVPDSVLEGRMAVRIHRNVILLQLASAAERSELQALVGFPEYDEALRRYTDG